MTTEQGADGLDFTKPWHRVPGKDDTFCQCEDGLHAPHKVAFWGAVTLLNYYADHFDYFATPSTSAAPGSGDAP